MEGTIRANLTLGCKVNIVLKEDQRTGKLTNGIVQRILTKSPQHPHGIKVRLTNGMVGRVKEIIEQ
ncbi:MAG: YwbE family protein [Flavobacteriales bacterium]